MDYSNPRAIIDRIQRRFQIIREIKQTIMDKDLLDNYGITKEKQVWENETFKKAFKEFYDKHPHRIRELGQPMYEAHPEYDAEIDKFMYEHCHPINCENCECSEVMRMFYNRPIDKALKNVLKAAKLKD